MPTWGNLKRHRYQAASTLDFKRQREISYMEGKKSILTREISEHNWEISNEPLLQKDFVQFQGIMEISTSQFPAMISHLLRVANPSRNNEISSF